MPTLPYDERDSPEGCESRGFSGRCLKLVVFDCDGVLFDSKDANRKYYDRVLSEFGCPPMTDDELEYVHTHSAELSIRHIFRKYQVEPEEVESRRTELGYEPFLRYMKMEKGLKGFLDTVHRHVKTAISTNRTTTMPAVLDMESLSGYFDLVVTAADVSRPKPHPEALLKILDSFRLRPEDGVFIGDSAVDMEHSASVGMEMIAFRNRFLKADHHADSFDEVAALPMFRPFFSNPNDGTSADVLTRKGGIQK